MKNLVLFFGMFMAVSAHSARTAEPKVTLSLAGSSSYREIVKTVDARAGLVCLSVNGDNGAGISCVKRSVATSNSSVIGTIGYREIKVIYDEEFSVSCAASNADYGAAISCQ